MARPIDSPDRISQIPEEAMTQFKAGLHAAGLFGYEVMRLLNDPQLMSDAVEAIKVEIYKKSDWTRERPCLLTKSWIRIAHEVQMKLDDSARNAHRIMIRVIARDRLSWVVVARLLLTDEWAFVRPDVQVKLNREGKVVVRRRKTL